MLLIKFFGILATINTMLVAILTMQGCNYCEKLKKFLRERNIQFLEQDVIKMGYDPREDESDKSYPVLYTCKKIIHGFNLKELQKLFDAAPKINRAGCGNQAIQNCSNRPNRNYDEVMAC